MNNLTTRKIVLGMLMALVLVFSVQGTADALTDPSISTNPTEFSTLNPGATITISGLNATLNDTAQRETLQLQVSGGGATFPHPVTTGTRSTDYTWTETDTTDPIDHNNGTLSLPGSVTITVGAASAASEIVVTVTWTKETGDTGTNTAVRRFYSVNPVTAATEIDITDGGGNGFVIRASGAQAIGFTASPSNIPITFTSSSGNLFVRRTEGGVTREGTHGRTLIVSSAIASPASVMLDLTATSTVTLSHPSQNPDSVVYIRGRPTVTITDGNNENGVAQGRLDKALSVRVTDGAGSNVAGIPVQFSIVSGDTTNSDNQFIPVPGTTVYVTSAGVLVNALAADTETIEATSLHPAAAAANAAMFVRTDSSGVAKVYLKLGTADDNTATADVTRVNASVSDGTNTVNLLSPFRQEIRGTQRIPTIEIVSGNSQRADADGNIDDPLIVVVKNRGQRVSGEIVTFTTAKGYLEAESDGPTRSPAQIRGPAKSVTYQTNSSGEAEVDFFLGSDTGVAEVVASISGTTTAGSIPYRDTVTFTINGTGSTGGQQQQQQQQQQPGNRLVSTDTSVSGAAGSTQTITISAVNSAGNTVNGVGISLNTLSSFSDAGGTFSSSSGNSPFEVTLTLPSTVGSSSSFTAAASGYDSVSISVTTTAPATLGTISITGIGTPSGGTQSFSISIRDTDGDLITVPLTVTLSGNWFTTRTVETAGGLGNARIALPTASGSHTLTASATGYTSGTDTVRGTGTGQQVTDDEEEEEDTTTTTTAVPDSVNIVGSSTRTGAVLNTELTRPLVVQVLDEDDDPVEDARVTFYVRSGRGRLSQRGSGRAIGAFTDDDGYASADYTPASANSTVEAVAQDVRRTVTFTITTGSAPAPGTTTRDADGTPGTISPVVHVGAAQRPPMLWVDGGAIYALVGADVERFAPGVDNALNIAVGGGKVYWTEKTGDSAGTINSADLDGSDVEELKKIKAVPMGIVVDAAGDTLYWTNSRGRIQSMSADGSGRIENVISDGLEGVMDIALAGGNAYWTEGGNVRFVNLRGRKQIRNISTGMDTAGSLAIGGGKVYWTEMTGENAGTINSANLNGSGAKELNDIRAVPMGIAIDTSRSKLYWTNSRGRIQRADLNGRKIETVVDGLGSPGDMVLSNSITAPAAGGTSSGSGTTDSNYDVNGDGVVDGKDKVLVLEAVMAGTYVAKYDVNNDKKLDILDYVLVDVEVDGGAAGAPALLGMKMNAVQIDRLQEQIDLLIATGDRSPAAMRTLIYLQQLIVMARPEKTQLLANYPNPFNPETWIPYELAADTTVKITIYNTQGVVIRTLELGHQSAGYYTGRDRAAYWDGRNAFGEQVASGIYFYQFETDEMSSMRKMVILK